MTGKEKTIKELKEALDSLDITNKYRLNLIRAIEYIQEKTNPSEADIAVYLGKKGWPLSTYGIPTYEEANKMMVQYYEYKKKQWIDNVCKLLANMLVEVTYLDDDRVTEHYDKYEFIENLRKEMEK